MAKRKRNGCAIYIRVDVVGLQYVQNRANKKVLRGGFSVVNA